MTERELAMRLNVEVNATSGLAAIKVRDHYLNYAAAEPLRTALWAVVDRVRDRGIDTVIVDLSEVNVMDSCGLSVLIALRKRLNGADGRLALAGLAPMVSRLFELTKLDRVFDIFDDVQAAEAELSLAAA